MQVITLNRAKIGKKYIIDHVKTSLLHYEIYGIGKGRVIELDQKSLLGLVFKISLNLSFGRVSFMIRREYAKGIFLTEYGK